MALDRLTQTRTTNNNPRRHENQMNINKPTQRTTHSQNRIQERAISEQALADAAADGYVTRQAGGRREVRGSNGLTFITDPTGEVLITVLPMGARTHQEARNDCGISRHRPNRRGPKGRDDSRKPRR